MTARAGRRGQERVSEGKGRVGGERGAALLRRLGPKELSAKTLPGPEMRAKAE